MFKPQRDVKIFHFTAEVYRKYWGKIEHAIGHFKQREMFFHEWDHSYHKLIYDMNFPFGNLMALGTLNDDVKSPKNQFHQKSIPFD